MTTVSPDLTDDGFLNGKLRILQPRVGYRAATDPVFLAAAVAAKAGETVLELGCGVGVASLCLAQRVAGLTQTGVELQPAYATLARENAERNNLVLNVIQSDITTLPTEARISFDHVMFNPPYFSAQTVTTPENCGKKTAHVEDTPLAAWVNIAFKRLKPKGTLTVIHLAERLPDLLTLLPSSAGDIHILPLASRHGRDAKRVILTARKGTKGAFRLLPPFHIHKGTKHMQDGEDFTPECRQILRNGSSFPC